MNAKFLYSLIFLLGAGSLSARQFDSGGLIFNTINSPDGYLCEVTHPETYIENFYTGDVEIPSLVVFEGVSYSVAGIGSYAFSGCPALQSVTFPESLSYVGRNAFEGCVGLSEVSLPTNVGEIGEQAFYGCSDLFSFKAPGLVDIGASAFSGCYSLSEFQAGSLRNISDGAFANCRSLSAFELPDGARLGKGVFTGCISLEEFSLPADLKQLPDYSFNGCSSLRIVANTANLLSIGDYAFYSCISLKEFDFGPETVSIGRSAFGLCRDLSLDSIRGKNAVIESFAFTGCESLENIAVVGVREIGEEAFANDFALQSVSFDPSIFSIAERAFLGCGSLAKVGCFAPQPPGLAQTAFEQSVYDTALLEVMSGKRLLYMQSPPWSLFRNVTDMSPDAVREVESDGSMEEVSCRDGFLYVEGAPGPLSVVTVSGSFIFRADFAGGSTMFAVPRNEIIIVSYRNRNFKILSE